MNNTKSTEIYSANTFDKVNRWRHEKVFGVLLNIFGASTQEELHSILTEMPIQQLLERAKVLQQYDLIVDPIFDNDFFTGQKSARSID